ncbi:MAG: hypothetical protein A3G52_00450 [Candidatus Taylorbacteria bacterium RIFCSPLOWO2_12_FULL_43_20]|uniref:Uncharacterized protein n=1 Tax=Candidatus Taylorbacteria bacterium RIFCSPLOWO2_12_FULL_43_20 TaxID=1802332 RepID=A0A1G2P1K4_9BACT|nr:MAG: hypothetical protein A2825_01780 [Candidatus Taylorbacteria bacterium RIFCSPHIGHO2_01_FULL_43_120]OHA22621.1 MAG: hypothetical protein A3B98_02550 [Candidatus Taylorbacteria bacterium RIFCSPHIGHO2_02_FULL_43_55]OHA28950.1 MAG: hypothetical protein A3E92_04775 [Candidatus Taylorbacteria bacterium RIFCSPHIGHO2_12_FULL_42_34]OHA31839.1 MAG: hypothetical protein A3B09_03635 [Candidatus Taylorbacteria bacterium RIFCSPLOWO2_01_FULL_43_83]OHA37748.1 MAG: hypothetical protein A3H58_01180 [Candi
MQPQGYNPTVSTKHQITIPIYELIRIYNSDASVGAPTEASGMDTNHPIPRTPTLEASFGGAREGKRKSCKILAAITRGDRGIFRSPEH